MSALSLENVTFHYPGETLAAIEGVSLDLHAGEVLALVGPNGAGEEHAAAGRT